MVRAPKATEACHKSLSTRLRIEIKITLTFVGQSITYFHLGVLEVEPIRAVQCCGNNLGLNELQKESLH